MVQPAVTIPDIVRRRSVQDKTIGKTPVWDFRNGDFVMNEQGRIMESSRHTILQIVFSALLTQFISYPLYKADFGSELHTLVGKDEEYVRTRLIGMVNDALNDPRIIQRDVLAETISITNSVISFTINITDINGNVFTRQIRIT